MSDQYTPKTIGQWIKHYRQAHAISITTLAEQSGYSVWTLRKIESGALQPSPHLAECLACALELPSGLHDTFLQATQTNTKQPPPPLDVASTDTLIQTQTPPQQGMLTLHEVATQLHVSCATIRRLVTAGAITAYRIAGQYRFTQEDVTDYLDTVRIDSAQDIALPEE